MWRDSNSKTHNVRYERSEIALSEVQRHETHHLFSSLLSMTSLCLLRASWLRPRDELFANKTRQPRKGFRLHGSKQLYAPETHFVIPDWDDANPEADTTSIQDYHSEKTK